MYDDLKINKKNICLNEGMYGISFHFFDCMYYFFDIFLKKF